MPDEEAGEGRASTALFFGYLGLFNAILLGPVGLVLQFTGLETFGGLTWAQFGLIIGKGWSRSHHLVAFVLSTLKISSEFLFIFELNWSICKVGGCNF